jgi:density-regulated protein DRP1
MTSKVIEYCSVCSFPFEYCEYSSNFKKCISVNGPGRYASAPQESVSDSKEKEKKEEENKASNAEIDDEFGDLDISDAEDDSNPVHSAGGKNEIIISRVPRTKKKNITYVKGLEAHIKLKDAVKTFKTKFACGSAVQKSEDGLQEVVVIQGDVQYDLAEYLQTKYKIPGELIFFYDPKTKSKECVVEQ